MIARSWGFVVCVAACVALAISAPASATFLITEDFTGNTDAAGSGWEFQNNRAAPQNFGWTNTNNTGNTVQPPLGAASAAGELGGTIARDTAPPTFYGYNVGAVVPTEDFEASGVVRSNNRGGGFNLGYFRGASSYGSGGNAFDFVGMFFDDSFDTYAVIYDAAGARNRSNAPTNLVSSRVHAFRMQYKTNGFNPDTLVVTIDGVVHTHAVEGFDAPDLLPLTHFGILPVSADGSAVQVYLDDLTFTVNPVPEPSTTVGGLSILTTALLRRRRRSRQ